MASQAVETAARPKKDRFTLVLFCVMCVVWLALTLRWHFDHAAATPAVRAHTSHVAAGRPAVPAHH
jgi:hypothetical protein